MLSFWPIAWVGEDKGRGAAVRFPACCCKVAAWSDEAISDWLESVGREAEKTAEEFEDKEEVALATPGLPE